MILEGYVAVMAALATTGAVLVVGGVRGTAAPPHAPPAGGWRRRWRVGVVPRHRRLLAGAALAAGTVALVVTAIPAVAVLVAAAVAVLPWLWNAGAREQRAIVRAEAVGQWTGRLRDRLATGSGLVSAIVGSAGSAPPPVAAQVRALANRIRAGAAPPQALARFADEVDDTVAEQVVAALLLHLEDRGEHLSEVLGSLASDAAQVVAMRREVHARRAQARMTVRFMIVLAGVVTVALAATGLLPVYATAAGQLVVLVLAAGFIAVLAWVHAMSGPTPPQRFLAAAEVA